MISESISKGAPKVPPSPFTAPSTSATNLMSFLAPIKLIPGESEEMYNAVSARLREEFPPLDVLDEFELRDIADLEWELLRLRRMRSEAFRALTPDALAALFDDEPHNFKAGYLSKGWAFNKAKSKLADGSITEDAIMAQSLILQMPFFVALNAVEANVEKRRQTAFDRLVERRERREEVSAAGAVPATVSPSLAGSGQE